VYICDQHVIVMDIKYSSLYLFHCFSLLFTSRNNSIWYLSIFLLGVYLYFPPYYLLSITPFCEWSYLLLLEPLLFPDYMLFSNHDHGYANLSKCLWLCLSKCAGVLNIYLFIFSHLNIISNIQTSRYLVGYVPVKSTKELLENWRNAKPDTSKNSMFAEFQTYFL
jgi:hypothetical protein